MSCFGSCFGEKRNYENTPSPEKKSIDKRIGSRMSNLNFNTINNNRDTTQNIAKITDESRKNSNNVSSIVQNKFTNTYGANKLNVKEGSVNSKVLLSNTSPLLMPQSGNSKPHWEFKDKIR